MTPLVEADRVLDRPRCDGMVAGGDELRAEHLRSTVRHAHAVEQARVVRGVGVAAVDRRLEVLERAPLEIRVAKLRDEPRGALTVFADQAPAGPCLVVVEDVPEAIRAPRAAGGARKLDQLGAEGLVPGHGGAG